MKLVGWQTHETKLSQVPLISSLIAELFFIFYPLHYMIFSTSSKYIKNPFASEKSTVDLELQHRQPHLSSPHQQSSNYVSIRLFMQRK